MYPLLHVIFKQPLSHVIAAESSRSVGRPIAVEEERKKMEARL
jgi:hypothetical protein